VTGAHYLPATRRDAAIHQKPIEGDAFITQRVALVYADDRRRQTLDIPACGEAGPRKRVAGIEGFDAISLVARLSWKLSRMPSFSMEDGYSGRGHSPAM
jgi:hypothetical protein